MKKIVCLILALVLCLSFAAPAMAAEEIFIPSMGMVISNVTIDGKDITEQLVLTTVADAKDGSAGIAKEHMDLLLDAYEKLSRKETELPYEERFSFFDMFCLSLGDQSSDLAKELAKDGVTVTMTLDPENVQQEQLIPYVLVDGQWVPAVNYSNNDDGTITVTLEDLGPIIFIVAEGSAEETEPAETEETEATETTETVNPPAFVPSISYKPGPDIMDVRTNIVLGNGEAYGDDKIDECVIVTSLEQARNKATDIHQEDRNLLIELYEKLTNGTMVLPVEKNYVIRDLMDINFLLEKCRELEDHQEKIDCLEEDGVTITIVFKMAVTPNTNLMAVAYDDETGEWEKVPELTINSDGTITLVLEEMSPVAFLTDGNANGITPWTGDAMGNSIGIWVAVMVICAAGIVALIVLRKKQK